VHSYFNPYDTPYDAFINYMNVLSDFEIRVNASVRSEADDQVARLSKIIKEKDEQLEKLEKRLAVEVTDASVKLPAKKSPVTKKSPAVKKATTAKKSPAAKKASSTVKKAPTAAKKAPATGKKKSSTTKKS
jgi:alpha-amylase